MGCLNIYLNRIIFLLILIQCVSCSSDRLIKFGQQSAFKQRVYNLDLQIETQTIKYYVTRENEHHCFNSNPGNKEIVTVVSDKVQYALNHFYKRMVNIDIKVYRRGDGVPQVETTTKEYANFNVETSNCIIQSYGGLFSPNDTMYTSFRLADK